MEVGTTIGARLKNARIEAGLSKDEVGEKCGIRGQAIRVLEQDQNRITLELAVKLCRIYGADVDQIVYGDEGANQEAPQIANALQTENAFHEMTVGERMRFCRMRHGLTQSDVADKLRVSVDSVRGWEKGQHAIRLEDAGGLCKMYGISLKELLPAQA